MPSSSNMTTAVSPVTSLTVTRWKKAGFCAWARARVGAWCALQQPVKAARPGRASQGTRGQGGGGGRHAVLASPARASCPQSLPQNTTTGPARCTRQLSLHQAMRGVRRVCRGRGGGVVALPRAGAGAEAPSSGGGTRHEGKQGQGAIGHGRRASATLAPATGTCQPEGTRTRPRALGGGLTLEVGGLRLPGMGQGIQRRKVTQICQCAAAVAIRLVQVHAAVRAWAFGATRCRGKR